MPILNRVRALAVVLPLLAVMAGPVQADGLRILATDERGVTLQVSAAGWSLSAPNSMGRSSIVGVGAAHSLADPGHALLPAYATMLAIPTDARPSVRVLLSDPPQVRSGVRLVTAGRPSFRPSLDGGDAEPTMEVVAPLTEGAWPLEPVRLGSPTPFRGRRLVSLEVRPFRYDERAGELSATAAMTVRVDFNRPAGAAALSNSSAAVADPHSDEVLAVAVLNFEQARAWRVPPRPSAIVDSRAAAPFANASFDESQPEVRVKIDTTGLYTLPFEDLAAKGYPVGVPVAQVSVHRHEFVENSLVPYVTVELPVEVEDANANGVFDAGDRIWTYQRTWAARSNASQYQRFWGDSDCLYVTVLPSGGLRMDRRDGWRNASPPGPLASYPHKEHFEKNYSVFITFIALPSDTTIDMYQWNENEEYYNRPDSIKFSISQIDTSRTVSTTIQWIGLNYSAHTTWAAVKNAAGVVSSLADSVRWTGKNATTVTRTLRGSAFTNGVNSFRQWGKSLDSAPDPVNNNLCRAGLNWFEMTYYRRFAAINDYLSFNSGDASGEYQIHATGFLADSIRVYDVTDPEAPKRLLIDASHFAGGSTASVDFQDSVVSGSRRSYVAAVVQDPVDPAYGPKRPRAANYTAVHRSNLYANTSGDYLLVVPELFRDAVQPLIDLRESQGLHVVVATLESVNDEFNGGRHSAAAIQRFVRFGYQNWQTRFLLLCGDGNLDPLNNRPFSGTDWVPTLPTAGPVPVSEFEVIPSDNRYGFLTGNPDPFFGFGDVIPEVMVGRLPVNSFSEAAAVVDKLVKYEDLSLGDPAWRRNMLLCSDDSYSGESFFGGGPSGSGYCYRPGEDHFVGLNTKIQSVVNFEAGLSQTNAELFNMRWYLANEPFDTPTPGDTCRPDRAATRTRTHATVTPILFTKLNAGELWWNYQGHASEIVLSHEDLYVNDVGLDDKSRFQNDGKPFLFTAFSCHANMFARPERQTGSRGPSLGEEFVTLPLGGAIGSWASVSYEVVPRDDSSHINVELARSLFRDPPRTEFRGDRGARVVVGEAIQAAFLRFLPTVASYSYERGIAVSYTLLGDPATRMSIGRPQNIVYANDSLVNDGQKVRLHSPGTALHLVADIVSAVRVDSLGLYERTATGTTPIPASAYALSPAFPDTATGNAYGGRRFRLTYDTDTRHATYSYLIRSTDRDGLQSETVVPFAYDVTLRVDGVPIQNGDDVSPTGAMSLLVQSPRPFEPNTDLTVRVNGILQTITRVAAPGDASGREWVVSWEHPPFGKDTYGVDIQLAGAPLVSKSFKVTTNAGDLRVDNLLAFPNPFDNDGTHFSFNLLGSTPADVRVSIMTISGRIIYSDVLRNVLPGYQQIAWDGRDAEGAVIGNGVYFYRLSVQTDSGRHLEQLGRIVKLRKPRHVDFVETP